jgi:hypothetical protein
MQLPQWARNSEDSFWRRHYELATIAEQSCEQAIEEKLREWLREIELRDGPAAREEDSW